MEENVLENDLAGYIRGICVAVDPVVWSCSGKCSMPFATIEMFFLNLEDL